MENKEKITEWPIKRVYKTKEEILEETEQIEKEFLEKYPELKEQHGK